MFLKANDFLDAYNPKKGETDARLEQSTEDEEDKVQARQELLARWVCISDSSADGRVKRHRKDETCKDNLDISFQSSLTRSLDSTFTGAIAALKSGSIQTTTLE